MTSDGKVGLSPRRSCSLGNHEQDAIFSSAGVKHCTPIQNAHFIQFAQAASNHVTIAFEEGCDLTSRRQIGTPDERLETGRESRAVEATRIFSKVGHTEPRAS
jgi:hypothetical protein